MNTGQRRSRNRGADYLVTALEALTALVALVYVVSGDVVMLIVWEAIAAGYLLGGLALTWYRSVHGRQTPPRTGVLDALSWIFPLVASLVGVNAALLAITVRAPVDGSRAGYTFTGVVAAVGIILSWQLLHTGFAQIYESMQHRHPRQPGLEFPRTDTPGLADYLYFAFTVGTSFATSDTSVTTVRTRWVVLLHSVVSFFYNALVVAVAIQIIQQIAGA